MADGDDDPPPNVIPLDSRRRPLTGEARDDARWELLARREARLARVSPRPAGRIPTRIRWWIAAAFVVAAVILLRERLAEWLPGLGF